MTAPRIPAIIRGVFGGNAPLWAALTPIVVFAAAALQLALSPVDPDYWWHLATGRWMLDHGRVPFSDPFSATHGGQTWYAHEWLSELVLRIADLIGGYTAGILLTAAIVAAGAWLLARAARYYGLGAREALLLVAGSGFFILGNLAVRPQVWGWALLALVLHELAADDNGRRRSLWYLPLIFVLWVNVHLSVLLGGAVVALYVLHRGLRALFARRCRDCERRHFRRVFAVAVLSALALCVNPRGPALIWFSRVYLNPHAVRYSYIGEWQRPAFSGDDRWLFVAGGAVAALAALAMLRRRTLWPGILALVFAFAAVRAIRYVPVFAVAGVPAAAWVLGRFRARRVSLTPICVPFAIAVPIAAGAVAFMWLSAYLRGPTQFRLRPDPYWGAYPVDAAAWVKANVPDGVVFNEYGWGGYLIWTFYPQRRVYMDGREEMYGERYFAQFVRTISANSDWQETFARANVQATITDPNGPLAAALSVDPGWRKAYADRIAAVFVPNTPSAQRDDEEEQTWTKRSASS
jgi:hypothetical protein